MDAKAEIQRDLDALARSHLRRERRTIAGVQEAEVVVDGRRVICLGSNNYLGLAGDARIIDAAIEQARTAGAGAGASPLVTGYMSAHDALERDIADWLGCEAALLFGSGYHANIGVLVALVGDGDEIFSDALNHASLIDGCRLSRAGVQVFAHRDVDDLERRVAASRARRKLIVSDSVFSMDGDVAPLAALTSIAERHGAWLMLDEAHATGVFGPTGAGAAEACGLGDRVTVRMGTIGKALGGYGAFVAGSRGLIELLLNRARAYVFSTALPPPVVGAARAAVAIARDDAARRARLWDNARRLHAALVAGGLAAQPFESPIVPLVLGASETALEVARRVLQDGVLAPAIRPPTVPAGTARLRLTPIATHTHAQIDAAAAALVRAASSLPSAATGARAAAIGLGNPA